MNQERAKLKQGTFFREYSAISPKRRKDKNGVVGRAVPFSPASTSCSPFSVSVNSLPHLICLRIDLLSDRSPTKLRVMTSTLAAAAARRVAVLSSPRVLSQGASFAQRRGLAGAADHHGPPTVNCWQDPMNPSKWKEEHFVIVSLSGWGLLFFGGYKFFTGGKGKKEEKLVEASH